jgi:hypothetical protein
VSENLHESSARVARPVPAHGVFVRTERPTRSGRPSSDRILAHRFSETSVALGGSARCPPCGKPARHAHRCSGGGGRLPRTRDRCPQPSGKLHFWTDDVTGERRAGRLPIVDSCAFGDGSQKTILIGIPEGAGLSVLAATDQTPRPAILGIIGLACRIGTSSAAVERRHHCDPQAPERTDVRHGRDHREGGAGSDRRDSLGG